MAVLLASRVASRRVSSGLALFSTASAHARTPHEHALTAVSTIDGRYARHTSELRSLFSEYGLIRHRVIVEVEWLRTLASSPSVPEVPPLSSDAEHSLRHLLARFDESGAARVKAIESETNHDVKAVEYWLKEAFAASAASRELSRVSEFLHFAATSEDVNNCAYALMLQQGLRDCVAPHMASVVAAFAEGALLHARVPMLSRTHGQPATPTTLGKEMGNFCARLSRQLEGLLAVRPRAKWNGAVGSLNAHVVAFPGVDWEALSRELVEGRLGLELAEHTTQVEPHDWLAEAFHAAQRFNTVLLGADRDLWQYVSLGYLVQRVQRGEVGSSTMPHKVNPIDFENSEGNLGLANALLDHLAAKLPVSRLQRDLSDSTALRAIGSALGHCLIAYKSAVKGLGKVDAGQQALHDDLDAHWEVLAEPIQTVMRRYGAHQPYEQLKELTRGQGSFGPAAIRAFVDRLEREGTLPVDAAQRLRDLTPHTYVGIAPQLATRAGEAGRRLVARLAAEAAARRSAAAGAAGDGIGR